MATLEEIEKIFGKVKAIDFVPRQSKDLEKFLNKLKTGFEKTKNNSLKFGQT